MNKFENWTLIRKLSKDHFLYESQYQNDNLLLTFKDICNPNELLTIQFKGVLGCQIFQEGIRMKTLREHGLVSGFYSTTHSTFLNWIHQESYTMIDDWKLTHYLVVTTNCVIDVISGPPIDVLWNSQPMSKEND